MILSNVRRRLQSGESRGKCRYGRDAPDTTQWAAMDWRAYDQIETTRANCEYSEGMFYGIYIYISDDDDESDETACARRQPPGHLPKSTTWLCRGPPFDDQESLKTRQEAQVNGLPGRADSPSRRVCSFFRRASVFPSKRRFDSLKLDDSGRLHYFHGEARP